MTDERVILLAENHPDDVEGRRRPALKETIDEPLLNARVA
jgi:hypothetical protein